MTTLTAEQVERRRESWRKYAAKRRASRTEEERQKHNQDCLERHHRKKGDPAYRKKRNAISTKTYDRKKKAEADRIRNASEENKERRREIQRRAYEAVKNDPGFRQQERQRSRENYNRNPEYYIAKGSESARRKKRTFGKLPHEEKLQILALYKKAREISRETGIPHEVDHIIPLRGKRISGLHVYRNLRVITAKENREKGNTT